MRRTTLRRAPRLRVHRGFALLSTLWLSVAIVAVALAFALESRRDRLAVTNLAQRSQAWAAARAGAATALSRLDRLSSGEAPAGSMPVDLSDPWQWADTLVGGAGQVGASRFDVHVRDAGAVVDINRATEDDWRNFFAALNVDADRADQLAQAIADWRDPDDDARSRGAERSAYMAAGKVILPANRNFESVSELLNVLGMTPELYAEAEPYLSAASTGQVSVNTAPMPVLRTIPQFTDDVVAAILAQRSSATRIVSLQNLASIAGGGRLLTQAAALQQRLTFTTQVVEITSTGWSADGRTRVVSTIQAGLATPMATIRWRRDEE